MRVELLEYPGERDWIEVYRRALVTVGKDTVKIPSDEWKRKILAARHSPIRYLRFSFLIELPYWVSVHLCRHTHAQPYVKTQRNDRQHEYDRNAARHDEPVLMIWDMNAEELLTIANKRLCFLAAEETRKVVENMRLLVNEKCTEFKDYLVPMCEYAGCHEMKPCGRKSNVGE